MTLQKREIVRLSGERLKKLYAGVDKRDGQYCQKTGAYIGDAVDHHHRQYKSRGGSDSAANLVSLLGPGNTQGSHGWAHSSSEARILGYSIPAFVENVDEVPIKIRHPRQGFVWARFFDDFTVGFMTERDAADAMRRLGIWREGEAA